ncbi:UvrD-helicase domain-containing protein [Hansschlegelia beijingensis]
MIEWIIGAALLAGGLFGSGSQSGSKIPGRSPQSRVGTAGDSYAAEVAEWRAQWESHVDRSRWIPKSTASRIVARFPPPRRWALTSPWVGADQIEQDLMAEFAAHNVEYLARQKERLKLFFETVEKNQLTDEQMDGCICMDDAVQIVAAAGSGKTSTMVAKVGYAIQDGLVRPEQILVLAFNRSVAEELQARIKNRLADFDGVAAVTVKTFNAFGLSVIGKATRRKPSLAEWAEPGRDGPMIVEIIGDLRQRDPQFRDDWDLFRTVFGRAIGSWNEPARPNTYRNGKRGILTANGEIVKSEEERMIADWLFYHGVRYDYEVAYEHDTVTEHHRQYKPDFFYPDIQLYHEHFALNERGMAPAHFAGDYLAGVRWKRALHAEMGTRLFETTSHEIRGNAGFARIAAELEQNGVTLCYDPDRPTKGQAPITTEQLAATIRIFQQHVKSNGLSRPQLRDAAKAAGGHIDRSIRFLALFARISDEWERRLRAADCIDFDDMLLMATDHIESGRFASPYAMILADEFQDVSRAKVRLLKALLKNAGEDAHLCVVGDDWQGINRFAGADIAVMTEFEKVFAHSTRLMLSTTFRCPAQLCETSSAFVQANPRQIKKTVKTTNGYKKKSLFAYAADNRALARVRLEQDLQSMYDFARTGRLSVDHGGRITVMLLGRYHSDEPPGWKRWQRRFDDLIKIEFRTVHSSKGLEADYVMLVNVVEGILGFPSRITDDPVLQIAMPDPDPYPMAEERRLFYVALTRARRQVRIYTLQDRPSRFLSEMAKSGAIEIETEGGAATPCPKCGEGALRRREGKYGPFEVCSTGARCAFKRNIPLDGTEPLGFPGGSNS